MFSTVIFAIFALFLICRYLTYHHDYWKKKRVPYVQPNIILGNIPFNKNTNLNIFLNELYHKFPNSPYIGYYKLGKPSLLLTKPEYIEQVLVKDGDFFWGNSFKINPELDDIIGRAPIFQVGQKWKKARGLFSPLITNVKMKHITPLLVQASKKMIEYIENKNTCEARDLLSRYDTDANALSAFGIEAKSFDRDYVLYRKLGKVMEPSRWTTIKLFCMSVFPSLAMLLRLRVITEDTLNYMKQLLATTLKHRKENNIKHNDLLDSIMSLKTDRLDDKDVLSLFMTFFGEPNTANQGSYILYALAKNPDVQKKLKVEIDVILKKHNEEITFQAIQEMNYLDCVISETMRLYPSIRGLSKVCTGYYEFPLEDGQEEVVSLEPGMPVTVPVAALQRDERYFKKADEFIPERFAEGNRDKIQKGSYLPFGIGRRLCVGMKFAKTLMKVSTVTIIKEFEIDVNEKTVEPFELNPNSTMVVPKCGLWINFTKRK